MKHSLQILKTQFGTTFVARYSNSVRMLLTMVSITSCGGKHRRTASAVVGSAEHSACFQKWLTNAIRSSPTNEDLRRAYFWESRRLGSQENEKFAAKKRNIRLNRLWKARWYSTVEILTGHAPRAKSTTGGASSQRKRAFAVIEGRRFILWESVSAFDNGELATGLVSFSGHAGITNPSPVELREIPKDAAIRAVTVFGKGPTGQQRLTLVLQDITMKTALEEAVQEIESKDD